MISDVGSVSVGHLEMLSQCAPKLSQGAPSLYQGALKVLVRSTLSLGRLPNILSQGTPGGVSRCQSTGYIETFF